MPKDGSKDVFVPAPALKRAGRGTSGEEWFVRFEARPGAGVHATARGASREPTETLVKVPTVSEQRELW